MATTKEIDPILEAISAKLDGETIKHLINSKTNKDKVEREIAYNIAFNATQAEMASKGIEKGGANNQTRSTYSKLEDINKVLVPIYTRNGLSMSFGEQPCDIEGYIGILCDIMHVEGHTKRYSAEMPLDVAGIGGKVNKTMIHGTGSAYTYGRRNLTCMIFNIANGEEDDDGNGAMEPIQEPVELIDTESVQDILVLIKQHDLPADKINLWIQKTLKCNSIDQIPVTLVDKLNNKIKATIKAKNKSK